MKTIQELLKGNLVRDLDNININDMHCNSCSVSKSTKASCKELGNRQMTNVLELIHSKTCITLCQLNQLMEQIYFLTFIDDYSRKVTVFCLHSKNNVTEYVRKYIARVERETDRKVIYK